MERKTRGPLVGVSACLLGDGVRFDGGHKYHFWLVEELGAWVEFVPNCPEMAMGLGAPRETLRLERKTLSGPVQMVGTKSETNLTKLARVTAKSIVERLPRSINGYVLKNRSPSCGLERVKVYGPHAAPKKEGVGFFAKELAHARPDIPLIEEGHLSNPLMREHFVTRLFAHYHVYRLPAKISTIQAFHQSYKYILLAHHEPSLRSLGRLAANHLKKKPSEVLEEYQKVFLAALAHPTNNKRRTNALQHMFGHIKDHLNAAEKRSVESKLEKYRLGQLPFVAIVTLLGHMIEQHGNVYVGGQKFLSPYPEELRLSHGL